METKGRQQCRCSTKLIETGWLGGGNASYRLAMLHNFNTSIKIEHIALRYFASEMEGTPTLFFASLDNSTDSSARDITPLPHHGPYRCRIIANTSSLNESRKHLQPF